jgi:hypothetical protein
MTIEFTYLGRSSKSFRDFVTMLPDEATSKPTRSTVPLLRYWAYPESRLPEFLAALGLKELSKTELAFEHATGVRAGRGKSSFTDLMILMEGQSIAVEAKFTEPRYETVKQWLGSAPTANRSSVLEGWLGAISELTGNKISVDAVGDLTYQLIHRTASLCCAPGPLRVLVYQVFGHETPSHYLEDLLSLAKMLGAGDRLQYWLIICPYPPEDRWLSWDKTLPLSDSAKIIREALLAGPNELALGSFEKVA